MLTGSGLSSPFPQTFARKDKRNRVLLVPNLSRAFSLCAVAAFRRSGYRAEALPLADAEAKSLGKRFVHNDICYPAQINIGEMLRHLTSGAIDASSAAVVVAKNCEDCRAGQYATLVRKALDDAGYPGVPIVTTGSDTKRMHPGLHFGVILTYRILWGIVLTDALEKMRLKVRPYEKDPGAADRHYDRSLALVASALERGARPALGALRCAVSAFNNIPVDVSTPRPRVFVIGEILMNYHETANNQIVRYLEKHGMEVVLPDMVDFFRRQPIVTSAVVRNGLSPRPVLDFVTGRVQEAVYAHVVKTVDRILRGFAFYEAKPSMETLARNIDGLLDRTYAIGEGWLIPAEIIEQAKKGVRAFVVIQPFGCLPNQVTGKTFVPTLKRRLGDVQILTVDYDADTSMANVENRLQMLIMAAHGSR